MKRPVLCLGLMCVILLSLVGLAAGQNGTVLSSQKISETAGNFTPGNAGGTLDDVDFFGGSVAWLGDLDGDGVADLAVGAYLDDDGGLNNGAVYVLLLNANGTVKASQKISDTAGNFTPGNAGGTLDNSDLFGISVAGLGDLDGDGVADLAVGTLNDGDGGPSNGAVYVVFLNANGTVKGSQKISELAGDFTLGNLGGTLDDFDEFGISVTGPGDLDGDGVADLAVGAYLDDDGGLNNGAVYVLFLNANGTVKASQKISDTAGNFTPGNTGGTLDTEDEFGRGVAPLGDLDLDGVSDLAVGAVNDDDGGSSNGAVYVLFMNSDGTVKASQKISDTAGDFTPSNAGGTLDADDLFGISVAGLGDLDGDGVGDLVVGAIGDDDGGPNNGAVYVLFLRSDGATAVLLSRFEAEPLTDGIELRWQFGDASQIGTSWVERAEAVSGPWARVEAEVESEIDVMTLVDRNIESDRSYQYMLVAELTGGQTVKFGPIEARAGELVMEFALTRLAPNPSDGPVRIFYAVAREAKVKLSVLDVQGRLMGVLVDGVLRAGRHQATWSGETERGHAPAGMYFIRYDVPGESFVKRAVLMRR